MKEDLAKLNPLSASHAAYVDHLFGNAVLPDRAWPAQDGVVGDCAPKGICEQWLFPLRCKS